MTQHEFDILTQKYLSGNCSPEEIALFEKWSEQQFNNSDLQLFFNQSEISETEERLWLKIRTDAGISRPKTFFFSYRLWWGIAACCTAILAYCFIYLYAPEKPRDVAVHGTETQNIAQSRQRVVLPDGSVVVLEKNAKIITAEGYGNTTRTVYLIGEAFFDVKRNTKVPFLVYSGELITQVLGTSFTIKPGPDSKTIEVSVKTGRVSVYAPSTKQSTKINGAIITPNQKVSYDAENKTIRQDIVDTPELIAPDISLADFQFEEATIESVLPIIQKAYGVEIVVVNPVLNKCAFTGDLNGLAMYKQLGLVCGVVNANYEVRGTTIFINGKGCKSTD